MCQSLPWCEDRNRNKICLLPLLSMGRKNHINNYSSVWCYNWNIYKVLWAHWGENKAKGIHCFLLNLLTAYLQENSRSSKEESRIASPLTKEFESNCLLSVPWTKKENTQLGQPHSFTWNQRIFLLLFTPTALLAGRIQTNLEQLCQQSEIWYPWRYISWFSYNRLHLHLQLHSNDTRN